MNSKWNIQKYFSKIKNRHFQEIALERSIVIKRRSTFFHIIQFTPIVSYLCYDPSIGKVLCRVVVMAGKGGLLLGTSIRTIHPGPRRTPPDSYTAAICPQAPARPISNSSSKTHGLSLVSFVKRLRTIRFLQSARLFIVCPFPDFHVEVTSMSASALNRNTNGNNNYVTRVILTGAGPGVKMVAPGIDMARAQLNIHPDLGLPATTIVQYNSTRVTTQRQDRYIIK